MENSSTLEDIEIDHGIIFIESKEPFSYLMSILTGNRWTYIGFYCFGEVKLLNTYDGEVPEWGDKKLCISDIYNNTINPSIEIMELVLTEFEVNIFKELIQTPSKVSTTKELVLYYLGLNNNPVCNGFNIINNTISTLFNLDITKFTNIMTIILPSYNMRTPIKIITNSLTDKMVKEISGRIVEINRGKINNIINVFVEIFLTNVTVQERLTQLWLENSKSSILIVNIKNMSIILNNILNNNIDNFDVMKLVEIYNNVCCYVNLEEIKTDIKQKTINLSILHPELDKLNKRQLEEFLHYITSLGGNELVSVQEKIRKRLLLFKM